LNNFINQATIFGCLVGLDDTVTGKRSYVNNKKLFHCASLFHDLAITFVALGTSLPDLFASRAAAMNEKVIEFLYQVNKHR